MGLFHTIRCCRCQEAFGMSEATYQTLYRSGADFHCPFGHPQHFTAGPTEAEQLRSKLQQQEQATKAAEAAVERERRWRQEASENARHAERRLAAQKGVTTRIKNRVANGVCPCCNRTFINLQRHMATKHAGFVAEEVQAEVGQTVQ